MLDVTPIDGVVRYAEGIHIGYRAWARAGATPAYPFGFGLGYTTWAIESAEVAGTTADGVVVTAAVRNTGDRAGKQVVQVYASRAASSVDRPALWLVGFAVVRCAPGQSRTVEIAVPRRAFEHWEQGWRLEPGAFELAVGVSSVDLPIRRSVAG